LYWFVSGVVAFIQQSKVLKQDETELEAMADKNDKKIIEGEVIPPKKSNKNKKSSKKRKRRR
jgi:membrane protein insertase Oxa1/YidC/SpoIIIJ